MIFNNFCFGQEEVKRNRKLDLINDPLTPSKAAFYSAVMPGLGQIYTGNAWKVPLVYAAIGTAVYSYSYNNKEMNKYRDAYKRRISGYLDDEYIDLIPQDEKLLVGMDFHKKYRDMSFIFIIGTYMLNILEANVSAHLMQFNVSDELSFKPNIDFEPITESANIGVKIKINL
ncbi:MAG: hypothetical protein CMC79_02305 [Flavobacteriaceae bacterium]|nr:hypothetical protein [Flavobacteriaceae bacterium]